MAGAPVVATTMTPPMTSAVDAVQVFGKGAATAAAVDNVEAVEAEEAEEPEEDDNGTVVQQWPKRRRAAAKKVAFAR
jgi:hypothetical protein